MGESWRGVMCGWRVFRVAAEVRWNVRPLPLSHGEPLKLGKTVGRRIGVLSAALVLVLGVTFGLTRAPHEDERQPEEAAKAEVAQAILAEATDNTDAGDLVRFIKTNKTARQDQAKSLQVQRGPQDAPASDGPEMDAAEIDTACQIAKAMMDGDAERLRLIIGAYKHKPYARAQITECLNYSFTMTGMDFRFTFHEFWFFVEPDRKTDGMYTIAISAFDPKPDSEVKLPADGSPVAYVLKTTEDQKEPGLFHLDKDETITPAAVMKLFQQSMQASAEKKKQHPADEQPKN